MNSAYIIDHTPDEKLYSVDYPASSIPPTFGKGWALSGSSVEHGAVSSGILTIEDAGTDTTNYVNTFSDNVQSDARIMVEMKVKIENGMTSAGFSLYSDIIGGAVEVTFTSNTNIRFAGAANTDITQDMTSDYVHIRVVLDSAGFSAWVNGDREIYQAEANTPTPNLDYVTFGKRLGNNEDQASYWDYFNFSVDQNYQDGFNKIASSACTISCSEVDSDFPLTNLYNKIPSKPCRFDNKSQVFINIDFGQTQECELIALVGHNLTRNANILIENDDNSSMSSADLTHVVEWNEGEIYILLTANYDNRYWRITIDDPGNDGNPYIGELIMGNLLRFSQNHNWGVKDRDQFNTTSLKTPFGTNWTYYYNTVRSTENIRFRDIEDDTAEEIEVMFHDSQGSTRPMVFVWDGDSNLQKSIYGKISDKLGQALSFTDVNNIDSFKIVGLPFAVQINDA